MANGLRKYHGNTFKLKVALTAIKGNKSAVEMTQEFGVASNQIYAWKKHLEDKGATIFSDIRRTEHKENELEKLHAVIGRLTIERDLLVRALDRSK
jgi:transposase-like protein